jgi:hypothetical protein
LSRDPGRSLRTKYAKHAGKKGVETLITPKQEFGRASNRGKASYSLQTLGGEGNGDGSAAAEGIIFRAIMNAIREGCSHRPPFCQTATCRLLLNCRGGCFDCPHCGPAGSFLSPPDSATLVEKVQVQEYPVLVPSLSLTSLLCLPLSSLFRNFLPTPLLTHPPVTRAIPLPKSVHFTAPSQNIAAPLYQPPNLPLSSTKIRSRQAIASAALRLFV